jgi:CubicO group peptidase (beta-lactamase class C family)
MIFTTWLVGGCGGASGTASPPAPTPIESIQRGLEKMEAADRFSGTVLVARNGRTIFARGYGYADREAQISNGLDTRFNLASVGKIFTAVAVARLVERGKLDFQDTLEATSRSCPRVTRGASRSRSC